MAIEIRKSEQAHVLIVDDDTGFTIRTSMILRKSGYQVSVVSNGEEALNLLLSRDRMPSVILLDLVMPVMDGWHFREIQKNHSKFWHVPVIIITEAPVSEEYALGLKASDILIKPFDRSKLFQAIGRAINGTSPNETFIFPGAIEPVLSQES